MGKNAKGGVRKKFFFLKKVQHMIFYLFLVRFSTPDLMVKMNRFPDQRQLQNFKYNLTFCAFYIEILYIEERFSLALE